MSQFDEWFEKCLLLAELIVDIKFSNPQARKTQMRQVSDTEVTDVMRYLGFLGHEEPERQRVAALLRAGRDLGYIAQELHPYEPVAGKHNRK